MTYEFCSIVIRNTVKQGRSLTRMVSPDEIQHGGLKSECLPSECWREENISRKALGLCFRSLFQNLVRRTSVQPAAKQTVFITVRTYSSKVYCRQFTVSRATTSSSSRTERHARHSPHCRLPAWVHWTRKLAAEQSRCKSGELFSVDSVVADGVTSQNFRQWSGEASSDRLLGLAKPEHTEPSDWSAAKKIDDCYQSKGWSCWVLSGLTISNFWLTRLSITSLC